MKDQGQTRDRLEGELSKLRRRVSELEKSESRWKKAEKELLKSENRLREILENSQDALYKRNLKTGQYEYISPAITEITGYTQDEVLSMTPDEIEALIHPEDKERLNDIRRTLFKTSQDHKMISTVEYRVKCKDGKYRWISDHFNIHRDPDGHSLFSIASVRDITERKKAEETLHENERKFRELQKNIPLGIFRTTPDGRILSGNPALARMFGYDTVDSILNVSISDLYSNIKQRKPVLKELDSSGTIKEAEVELVRNDGSKFWATTSAAAIRDKNNKVIYYDGILNDITERKLAEEEIKYRLEFEDLISSLSTQFINLPIDRMDEGINQTLQKIGEFVDVDRSYIFQFYDNGAKMDNAHEWCHKGIEPQIQRLQGLPTDAFPWAISQLKKHKVISIHRVADLPPEASAEKKEFQQENIKSLVFVPLGHGDYVMGFLGFDSVRRERKWSDEIIMLLQLTGQVITNALERKRAGEALKESEGQYRGLVEKAGVAIVIDDKEGRLKFVNEEFLRLTGYSRNEIEKLTILSIVHPEDVKLVMKYHNARIQGKKAPSRYGFRGIRKDGSSIYLEVDVTVLKENGNIMGTRSYIWDITEQKKTEEELKQREELQSSIFRAAPMGIGMVINRNFKFMNDQFCKMTGYSSDELIGKNTRLVYPSDEEYERVGKVKYDKIKKTGIGVIETRFRRKDGKIIDVWLGSSPINPADLSQGVIFTALDITERNRVRNTLMESEKKFRSLAEKSPNMIFINKGGRVVYANQKCEEMMGYKRDVFYSPDFDFLTLIAPENIDTIESNFSRHMRGKEVPPYEYSLINKKGERIEAIMTSKLIDYEEEKAILGIATDITEKKKAEEAIQESEMRFRGAFESAAVGVALINLEGRFLKVNPYLCKLLGYAEEELKPKTFNEVTHPDDYQIGLDQLKRLLSGKIKHVQFEKRYIHKNGKVIWVTVCPSLVRDEKNKPLYFVTQIIDITDRKSAEKVQNAVYMISEKAHATESLNKLYLIIHDIISDLMPAKENFYIALYDKDKQMIDFPYFVDEFEANPGPQKFGKGLTEYVIRTGKPLLASPKVFNRLEKKGDIVSVGPPSIDWLGVPLKIEGKTIGIMVTQSYTEGIRFKKEDKEMVTFVSEQVAMAIDRKQKEEALLTEKDKLEGIIASIGDGLDIVGQDYRVHFQNNLLKDRFGDLTGKLCYEEYMARKTPCEFCPMDRAISTGSTQTVELIGADGRDYEVTSTPFKDIDRETKVVEIVRDITERKQAEEALQESEEKYRTILESIEEGYYEVDLAGNLTLFNDSMCRMLEYPRDELMGMNNRDYMDEKSTKKVYKIFNKVYKTGVPTSALDFQIVQKGGVKKYGEISVSLIRDSRNQPIGFRGVVRDITEKKQAEEELKDSREQLRDHAAHLQYVREEERTNISREIHDELGQTLTGLKMDISWLEKKLPQDQEKLLKKIQEMKDLTDYTIQTVQKISSELRPGLLDDLGLSAAIEWQIDDFRKRSRIDCNAVLSEEIALDPERSTVIFRIFQETLTNIARHAKASKVMIRLKEKNGQVELQVKDNGKGITEDQITNPKSYGIMGMKERVEFFKGEIKIKGDPESGTRITVRIPMK